MPATAFVEVYESIFFGRSGIPIYINLPIIHCFFPVLRQHPKIIGQFLKLYDRWWFQICSYFHPYYTSGRWIQFDYVIFFRWVGSTGPTSYASQTDVPSPQKSHQKFHRSSDFVWSWIIHEVSPFPDANWVPLRSQTFHQLVFFATWWFEIIVKFKDLLYKRQIKCPGHVSFVFFTEPNKLPPKKRYEKPRSLRRNFTNLHFVRAARGMRIHGRSSPGL